MGYAWPTSFSNIEEADHAVNITHDADQLTISFSWAFPVIHDVVNPVYAHILRNNPELSEQLSRIHGAAIMTLLADTSCDRQSIITCLYQTYDRLGLDRRQCVALHNIIMNELTAVIALRNRQSPRRRAELEAVIALRLGLIDEKSRWRTPPGGARRAA
ncbi:MAG: hypothetical protein KF735_05520 [Chelatococcus sp.]|jgi:hypothetical protein|uniref:hypothetical protein n=1 Tax=unclassified Chelatococcus TaxID=2638111 RepID=UPI001BD04DBA|nr:MULTISPECIES: hypothetical protein [unclassified Chelatococcus]CAH1653875.1 conserved hypothetical protein [Hyphomicrobiales bacterium]MBS7740173.1 hypothetical protein [Chelatococcus sp. HY11]MBX3537069.1 hypothetical protein [Chelatococcus sp.]MBX3544998.1 hypothetical protein [Chelatococcus sp.]MCO5079930.1 hypothetical protein [Chelatococcus sp.]